MRRKRTVVSLLGGVVAAALLVALVVLGGSTHGRAPGAGAAGSGPADELPGAERIWIHPNRLGSDYGPRFDEPGGAADFKEIFSQGSTSAWAETRARIHGFSFFAQNPPGYGKTFFRKAFRTLAADNKPIRFEYSPYNEEACTTEVAFDPPTRRFFRLVRTIAKQTGARIEYVTLDSPWRLLRDRCGVTADRVIVRETAELTERLARVIPEAKIGEIEEFVGPAAGSGGTGHLPPARYARWFDRYARYVRRTGVGRRFHHFHVDFDWTMLDQEGDEGALRFIRQLRAIANKRGRPFSLLFSASNVNAAPDDVFPSDKEYYDELIREVQLVENAGIELDEYVIQSFFPRPSKALPESEPYTFMNAARDAIRILGSG